MTVRWITWAWDQVCPSPGAKLLLVALADHAGEDAGCWPSTGRLIEKTGLSRATIFRHLAALEEHGLIRREERFRENGSRTSSIVHLETSPPSHGDTGPPSHGDTGNPSHGDTPVRLTVTPPEPSVEPPEEPSDNERAAKAAKPRPRNPLWDALEAELGPAETRSAASLRGKAVRDLGEVNATPEEVRRRCSVYRFKFKGCELTETALLKHWGRLNGDNPQPELPESEWDRGIRELYVYE